MSADPSEACDPGEHALVWSDDRLMLVCDRCGLSAQNLSDDVRTAADQ